MKMLISMVLTLGIILFASRFMMGDMMDIPGLTGAANDAEKGLGELGNAVVKEDVTVYQWTDAEGVTHFGGTPPTGQGAYEKKEIRASTNVLQAQKLAEEEPEEPRNKSQIAKIGSVYTPEGVKDLVTDTKDLQKQLNERVAEQDKILNDIMGSNKN